MAKYTSSKPFYREGVMYEAGDTFEYNGDKPSRHWTKVKEATEAPAPAGNGSKPGSGRPSDRNT